MLYPILTATTNIAISFLLYYSLYSLCIKDLSNLISTISRRIDFISFYCKSHAKFKKQPIRNLRRSFSLGVKHCLLLTSTRVANIFRHIHRGRYTEGMSVKCARVGRLTVVQIKLVDDCVTILETLKVRSLSPGRDHKSLRN